MATANQIKALLRSHIAGDDEHFLTVAMQLAAHEAKQGHTKLASELKQFIDQAKIQKRQISNVLSLVQPKRELEGILEASQSKLRMANLTFSEHKGSYLDVL